MPTTQTPTQPRQQKPKRTKRRCQIAKTSWFARLRSRWNQSDVIHPGHPLNFVVDFLAGKTNHTNLHFLNIPSGGPENLDARPRLAAAKIGCHNRGSVLCPNRAQLEADALLRGDGQGPYPGREVIGCGRLYTDQMARTDEMQIVSSIEQQPQGAVARVLFTGIETDLDTRHSFLKRPRKAPSHDTGFESAIPQDRTCWICKIA